MKHRVIYFPIKILLGFLVFTELLFFLGPIQYEINNSLSLVVFFIMVNLALYLGYRTGVKKGKITSCKLSKNSMMVLLCIGLALNVHNMYLMWSTHNISVSLQSILFALINPGDVYHVPDGVKGVDGSLIWSILSPLRFASVPIGIFYWSKLTKLGKFLLCSTIMVIIVSWLGIGTRKGLLDIILIVAFSTIASNRDIFINSYKRKLFNIVIVSAVGAFIFYFIFSNMSRYTFTSIEELSDLYMMKYNYKEVYQKHINPIYLASLAQITDYLCQGYYALSKGLEIGIISPSLLSMSWFSILIANKLGFDPLNSTYMVMLESYGIDRAINWHSIYLWLANEFTFILVPFIIYCIGYFFAITWKDSVHKENPWSYPIMTLFVIMVFYSFANNQVFSGSYLCFIGCMLIYRMVGKRITFK